jgi:hypothetical protein
MNTLVFQPGMTWRKLAYALSSTSLAYRQILDENPIWNVMESPPPGVVLRVPSLSDNSGGASQQPSVYSQPSGQASPNYYPFTSEDEYFISLFKYSSSALRRVERINGPTNDSTSAFTGRQDS